MAYSELVKRFDRVRDYMRDFLIFGYKTRGDFDQKSARTYDNERRRIESWLGDGLRWEYRPGGKAVFLPSTPLICPTIPSTGPGSPRASPTTTSPCTFTCWTYSPTAGPATRKKSRTHWWSAENSFSNCPPSGGS